MLSRWYLCTFALLLVSCAQPVYQEQGWASHIANQYAGRMTSSGQPYNPQAYTAAHNSLPFGTEITVKNVYTGRSVQAVVNDRFPYYPGRVVNLSSAAAYYIGMTQMQLLQVQVTAKKLPQASYSQPQAYPPQNYAQPAYAQQQPAYQPQPNYGSPPQPAYNQSAPAYTPQYHAAPTHHTTPKVTAPKYTAPRPSYHAPVGGAPNAPVFNGGGPPAGLKTF
ncbi:MAG: septal ring lytic transglycosylase RlpA family protein [Prosthecobacter sp.]